LDCLGHFDGVSDIFIDRKTRDEFPDDCLNTPLDINVEGDAYASEDEDDHSDDVVLDHNCTAWD
jgi:hypothetical protein